MFSEKDHNEVHDLFQILLAINLLITSKLRCISTAEVPSSQLELIRHSTLPMFIALCTTMTELRMFT